jgi:hypothetical protein
MQIPPTELRADVEALLHSLKGRGFTVIEERYDPQFFGNVLLRVEHDQTAVRIVCDRGEWRIDIAGPGQSDWFGSPIWHGFLDDHVQSVDVLSSFDEEALFFVKNLPRIEDALRDQTGSTLSGLDSSRSRREALRKTLLP